MWGVCVHAHTHTHTHTHVRGGILFSHRKKENPALATAWTNLEGIMLSEIKSDRERHILYDVTYVWNIKNSLTHKYREQIGDCQWQEVWDAGNG